ncbi:MAG TPA: hypothetical protein VH969_08265 [Actinophytocola sp.]|jgi:hypothetical protein|uniref:AMIN-like domain-containing (lipo)protein n=1 Tax=Actinophytocola sp. TaxID=1872138 RepID=UPI002F932411
MRKMIALLAVFAATMSVAACASDPESSGSTVTTARSSSSPTARGTPADPPPADPTTSEAAECSETDGWNTEGETAAPFSTDALYLARAGRHDCYDRLVLDVNGAAEVGYAVRYVPVVTVDGSGKPIPVAGKAALQVVVHAPPQGLDSSGHQPGRMFANTGDFLYTEDQLAGWDSLRAVRFAGFFEGQSTLAVGVSAKLPFRVSTQFDKASQIRKLVIDIAHDQS